MTERELRARMRAMAGEMPPETHAAFTAALLPERKEKTMKRSFTAGIALAIALLLLGVGAACAASDWNIAALLDLWQPHPPLEEDPTRAFTDTTASGETELASFSVVQAYHDGHSLISVVKAEAKDPEALVLGTPSAFDDDQLRLFMNAGVLGRWTDGGFPVHQDAVRNLPLKELGPAFSDSTQTLGEWMDEHGKTKVIFAFVRLEAEKGAYDPVQVFGGGAYEWALQEDGSLLLLRRHAYTALGDEMPCLEYCFADPELRGDGRGYHPGDYTLNQNLALLSFTVKANERRSMARVEGPFLFPGREGYQADWAAASVGLFGVDISVSWRFPPYDSDSCLPDGEVGVRLDARHVSNRRNSTYTIDSNSEWAQANPNCYGLQTVHFSDLTALPDAVILTCGDQQIKVEFPRNQAE